MVTRESCFSEQLSWTAEALSQLIQSTALERQDIYNAVVDKSGCSGATDTPACLRTIDYETFREATDTLACLRTIDYETFLEATTSIPGAFDYQFVAISYLPRPDGSVLT
jgi:hypothetical protein